jgi:hypothetical protein
MCSGANEHHRPLSPVVFSPNKTAADDVRSAMAKMEDNIPSTKAAIGQSTESVTETPEIVRGTFRTPSLDSTAVPATVN